MNLPKIDQFEFSGKRVLVRVDVDVPLGKKGNEWVVQDESRLKESWQTIKFLQEKGVEKIVLMGHLGRPGGRRVEELVLEPVASKFREMVNGERKDLKLRMGEFEGYRINEKIVLLENLRFYPGEEGNDLEFARKLAGLGEVFVNEAFASSHREHASIVGVPRFLPHKAGFHFALEVENLGKVLEKPKRPLVLVIGGAKPETKLPLIKSFARLADKVLVGGALVKGFSLVDRQFQPGKIVLAELKEGGWDIDGESIKKFEEIIKKAGTVVWNGPMGKYEEEKWGQGTKKIAEAIADSLAFKVVGGGDTISALVKYGLVEKMDFVSTGGGAMLEFLAKGSLPGIEALLR